jgi:integrase
VFLLVLVPQAFRHRSTPAAAAEEGAGGVPGASVASRYPAGLSRREGGYMNLHAWRRDEWYPALEGAGLPHLTPYSMRHTFASFAIAAGVSLFYLARLMGSSVEQIDKTYGHLLPESEEYLRGLLDTYDDRAQAAAAEC